MTDKEYRIQKARIRKLIKKWVKPLGLGWWRVTFDYHREQPPSNTDYAPKSVNGTWVSAMTTMADPYYLTATIDCYLNVLKDCKDDDLEEYFVHELMHVLLSPMHHKKKAAEEELVATKLAQAVIWTNKKK
jgi:hypothetical protein